MKSCGTVSISGMFYANLLFVSMCGCLVDDTHQPRHEQETAKVLTNYIAIKVNHVEQLDSYTIICNPIMSTKHSA